MSHTPQEPEPSEERREAAREDRPSDASYDYRESPEEVRAAQERDVPPTPRGKRFSRSSRAAEPAETPPRGSQAWGTERSSETAGAAPRIAPRRPLGVVLIAVLLGVNALGALFGLFSVLFGGVGPGAFMGPEGAAGTGVAAGTALYFGVIAAVLLVVLYGFWRMTRWGWWGALILTTIGTALGFLQLVAMLGMGLLVWNLIGVAIGIAVIWYLLRGEVRARFVH